MPLKDCKKRKEYRAGYWKRYYADPVRKARHLKAVRKNDKKRIAVICQWLDAYKMEMGCKVCGWREHPVCLDFAHRDRATKELNLSETRKKGWSLVRVKREAAKCDVLCANHHRLATFEEAQVLKRI
jgi:hypothetical protein